MMLGFSMIGFGLWFLFVDTILSFYDVEEILGVSILELLDKPLGTVLDTTIWLTLSIFSLALFWNGLKPVNTNILDS